MPTLFSQEEESNLAAMTLLHKVCLSTLLSLNPFCKEAFIPQFKVSNPQTTKTMRKGDLIPAHKVHIGSILFPFPKKVSKELFDHVCHFAR